MKLIFIGILVVLFVGLASGESAWQVYEEALDPQAKNMTENDKAISKYMSRRGNLSEQELEQLQEEKSQVWTIAFLGIFLILLFLICLWLWWKGSKWL